jgi:protein-tyrosine phosphatase
MHVRLDLAQRALLFAPYLAVFYPYLAMRRAAASLHPDCAWRSWLTPQILLGGFLLPSDVAELHRLDVRAVVNVSRELWDPVSALRAAGIDYLRVPSWDMRAPTLEEAARGVAFIERHIAVGERVHVHCASGVGRSVTLVLCYLATCGGMSVDEALALVKQRRARVSLRRPQHAFVDRFVRWHRAQAGGRVRTA